MVQEPQVNSQPHAVQTSWKMVVFLGLLPWMPVIGWFLVLLIGDSTKSLNRDAAGALAAFTWLCVIAMIVLDCVVVGIAIRRLVQRTISIWKFFVLNHFTVLAMAVILWMIFD